MKLFDKAAYDNKPSLISNDDLRKSALGINFDSHTHLKVFL